MHLLLYYVLIEGVQDACLRAVRRSGPLGLVNTARAVSFRPFAIDEQRGKVCQRPRPPRGRLLFFLSLLPDGLSQRTIMDKTVIVRQLHVVEAHGILLFRTDKMGRY